MVSISHSISCEKGGTQRDSHRVTTLDTNVNHSSHVITQLCASELHFFSDTYLLNTSDTSGTKSLLLREACHLVEREDVYTNHFKSAKYQLCDL